MSENTLFFPKLVRRKQYKTKHNGEYYADYGEYRQEVREDCLGRCVYCDLHENDIGGSISMKLDHFRPKKYAEYKHLINDPTNLVWACEACNRGKWDYWPALGSDKTFITGRGFVDVFQVNRLDYFEIRNNGELHPVQPPAKYMIELLSLNRKVAKLRRELRLQAYQLIPHFEREIKELEEGAELNQAQKANLEKLRVAISHFRASLNFVLY